MSRQRDILVNFERMWREMDELIGDPFSEKWTRQPRAQSAFSPRVDVYYCGEEPRAVVNVELSGVDVDAVSVEVSGRSLIISGVRPLPQIEDRVYQQVEIEAGPFRRVVELGADVAADRAQASYEDGILTVELPLAGQVARRVPIEPAGPGG